VVLHTRKIDIVPMLTLLAMSLPSPFRRLTPFSQLPLPIRARIAAVSSTATIHGHFLTSPTRRVASFAATREEVCGKDEFEFWGVLGFCASTYFRMSSPAC
jgi:hypothetical protein